MLVKAAQVFPHSYPRWITCPSRLSTPSFFIEGVFAIVLLRDGGRGSLLRGRSRTLLRGSAADVDGGQTYVLRGGPPAGGHHAFPAHDPATGTVAALDAIADAESDGSWAGQHDHFETVSNPVSVG